MVPIILFKFYYWNWSILYFIEKSLNDDFQIKVDNIEVDLDCRVESMINEINKYRDECVNQLKKSKLEFRRFDNTITLKNSLLYYFYFSLIIGSNLDKLKSVSDKEKRE